MEGECPMPQVGDQVEVEIRIMKTSIAKIGGQVVAVNGSNVDVAVPGSSFRADNSFFKNAGARQWSIVFESKAINP
jgi:hypothetical protein